MMNREFLYERILKLNRKESCGVANNRSDTRCVTRETNIGIRKRERRLTMDDGRRTLSRERGD